MNKSSSGSTLIHPAAEAADLLVICTESGTVCRPSALGRKLQRLDAGQTIERRCAYCRRVTLHSVMHRADADNPDAVVESLVSAFEHVGVIVRRYPKNWTGQGGVAINRYRDHGGRQEVMLFGPIASAELVRPLRNAHDSRTLPDVDFTFYRDWDFGTRWHPPAGADGDKFNFHRFMATIQLHDVFGQPPEVGHRPEPPMWEFATKLTATLSDVERRALAAVLLGRKAADDERARLAAPFGYRDGTRTDLPDVLW